jgi:hypothetical protein
MKSIANQYKDLKEGKMSQHNFMRNLRMSMPQYITNVTSFNDAVKILKNKSILTEAYTNEAPSYNYNGKKLYVDNQSGEPDAPGGTVSLYDEENNEYKGIISSIDGEGMISVDEESIKPAVGGDEDGELEDIINKMEQGEEEEKGLKSGYGIYDPLEEAKKPKTELHPNQINPSELRMGIRVELEHTDDLDKAKKIALDHLAENPYYYTALKLAGVESPSAPKVKAPVEKKAKKKKEAVELVDKANAMQKVKMPKIVKEARLNIDGEPNAVVKQAMGYVEGPNANPTLKAISDQIEFQQTMDPNEALLRYGYWEELPGDAIEKLELQFNVEVDRDTDEDTGEIIVYRLTPKNKLGGGLGSSLEKGASKASQMDLFKETLESIVREVMAEYYDGRDNLDAENEY